MQSSQISEEIEVYDGRTWTFQQVEVRSLFENNLWLLDVFGKDWCQRELLFEARRPFADVHDLFFRFGPLDRGQHLIDNLALFKRCVEYTRFIGFINKLKNDRDNVAGNINNLSAYCYLQRRGVNPIWEPNLPEETNSGKKPDLGIPRGEELIYVEVVTIKTSDKDNERSDKIDELRARVNAIPNILHDVSVSMGLGFQMEDIEEIYDFIKAQIESGSLPNRSNESVKHQFEKDRRPIASIHFTKTEGRRGVWMGSGGPTMCRTDSVRAKGKLLAKLKKGKFQLPPNAPGGFIVCLDAYYMSFRDVVDAVNGQKGVGFSLDGKTKSMRFQDGVLHSRDGLNIADVDFLLVADRTQELWIKENMQIMMNGNSKIPRDEVENIFLE